MKNLTYILILFFVFDLGAQLANPPNKACGELIPRDSTFTYNEINLNCGEKLVLGENSTLIIDIIISGYGIIKPFKDYAHPATLIFNSCVEDEMPNIDIDSRINVVFPPTEDCQILNTETINPNDETYLLNWKIEAFNMLGKSLFKGKYKDFRPRVSGVYLLRFNASETTKAVYNDNGERL